jgi:hypothetical protein
MEHDNAGAAAAGVGGPIRGRTAPGADAGGGPERDTDPGRHGLTWPKLILGIVVAVALVLIFLVVLPGRLNVHRFDSDCHSQLGTTVEVGDARYCVRNGRVIS